MRRGSREGKISSVKRGLLITVSLLLLLVTVGCASGTLPLPLSAEELHRWSDTHLGYTVGVEPYRWPTYSNGLLAALQGTHLFISVRPLDQCTTPPTLIARVEE